MPRLKQVDATIMSEPVKRIFPFGGYTNSRGEFVEVDDDAFLLRPSGRGLEGICRRDVSARVEEGFKNVEES